MGALVGMYSPIKALPQVRSANALSGKSSACLPAFLPICHCCVRTLLCEKRAVNRVVQVLLLFSSFCDKFLGLLGAKS